jgi:ATP-dependent DNA helicase RecQ
VLIFHGNWNQYLIQLINLGYCEIAFHKQNKIQLTSLAKKVLFEGEKVQRFRKSILKQEIKETKNKSVANSLLKPYEITL